ncbi:tyrosine-type recombinase/integrase [Tsukamurella paurometabola]|uniref:Integrase n=1 Tax=Tsukamurella paurometabola TaxID=2061 RepID=A0A3P8KBY2_TSUPA|nr:site-specific integrase [Tsukamurella paurometabola]UEA84482.1 site-specific integrase [Tsukamurella paurometabola]VDR37048.1 Integrase [Tsukamurella paurometabola]
MATVESYTLQSGARRYRVRYRMPDHRQTDKRGFTTKRAAEAFAATVEVEKLRGEYVPPALGRITVGELGPDWLAAKKIAMKPSGYLTYDTAWRVHVEPRWAGTAVASITTGEVETWITDMQRTVTKLEVQSDGTEVEKVVKKGAGAVVVLRAYGILAGILDGAVKAGRLARNPARGVENLPRKPSKKTTRRYLTHAQVDQLAAEAGDRATLVYFLAYTGLRWGEATGLRVEHLDLLRRRLTVAENAVLVGTVVRVGTPKGHEARTVALPEFLVELLAKQCEGKPRDGLLFPGPDGAHQKLPASGTGWLEHAVRRAGVPRVTAHDLRHTAASLAVQAGAHVKAVQRMLGHASAAMTLDVYSDLFDSDLDAVAIALNQARSAPSVGTMWAPTADAGE